MTATELQAARAAVNAETFGTAIWESKMQAVRDLVAQENANAPTFEYTSIDGDIFAHRGQA